jgi:hypothetical protein
MDAALAHGLGQPVAISPEPQMTGALGADLSGTTAFAEKPIMRSTGNTIVSASFVATTGRLLPPVPDIFRIVPAA